MSFDLPKSVRAAKRLPRRQQQVLRGLAEGKQRKELADELRLSENTVDRYCEAVYEKLNVHKLSEATRVACCAGLI